MEDMPKGYSSENINKKQVQVEKSIMDEEEKREEYERYMNKQMRILKGHHERIMLRLLNKFCELFFPKRKT